MFYFVVLLMFMDSEQMSYKGFQYDSERINITASDFGGRFENWRTF